MEFLGEEVDGALAAQKIRGETSLASSFTPTAATRHSTPSQDLHLERVEG